MPILLNEYGQPYPVPGSGKWVTMELVGLPELLVRLNTLTRDLGTRILRTAITKAMLVVARRAALHHLTGPRWSVLGVKSNLLRGSVMPKGQNQPPPSSPATEADTIWEVTQSGGVTTGRLGSRVKYAATHEEGMTIVPRRMPFMIFYWERYGVWVHARQVVMPRRAFLGPALIESEADVNTVFNHEIQSELTAMGF